MRTEDVELLQVRLELRQHAHQGKADRVAAHERHPEPSALLRRGEIGSIGHHLEDGLRDMTTKQRHRIALDRLSASSSANAISDGSTNGQIE